MSDKEMISKAFASLKAPDDTLERIHEKMNKESKRTAGRSRVSIVLTAALIVVLSTAVVYAAKAFFISKDFLGNGEGNAEFSITAPFNGVNQFTGFQHDGIDYGAAEGTPVMAAATGRVEEADFDADRGYYIILSHNDGFSTLYAHLKELWVAAGDTVEQGQEIGTVGKTGKAVGAHLHLELWLDGNPVDPADYWAE